MSSLSIQQKHHTRDHHMFSTLCDTVRWRAQSVTNGREHQHNSAITAAVRPPVKLIFYAVKSRENKM